ncbi:enoyl-CoA hydratase-related protein [Methylovirgula sp. 4M-Z18]|uniref:enoyl-CoA hydratase-related protein n=1 Tax=Methylovirgula sp. 4M-Z18 TaxID=2293567 RepID=UPI000E2E802D|nr:enoyl-CoA hydratase-related protein [Methylovirgula sp. 4M-Z18]RFB79478.1 crotonobetainyl-CoA hydratase [Methylovirgula sp. 4M-Z18]
MVDPLHISRHGRVLQVVLDRPKANAIDVATSRALYDVFRAFQDDCDLRVAILTGGGERFFSAGWDLKAQEAVDTDFGPGGFAGLTEFWDLDKPVIAAVNGLALGGGFELALACDLIVAAEEAEFALPEVTLGIVAESGGVQRLPRRLPQPIAMEMLLTGRRMGAQEAHRFGLVNRVAPRASLLETAHALAAQIAAHAPLAIRTSKAVARLGEGRSVRETYAAMLAGEAPIYHAMLTSEDAQEGPRAFAEKRAPEWKGR